MKLYQIGQGYSNSWQGVAKLCKFIPEYCNMGRCDNIKPIYGQVMHKYARYGQVWQTYDKYCKVMTELNLTHPKIYGQVFYYIQPNIFINQGSLAISSGYNLAKLCHICPSLKNTFLTLHNFVISNNKLAFLGYIWSVAVKNLAMSDLNFNLSISDDIPRCLPYKFFFRQYAASIYGFVRQLVSFGSFRLFVCQKKNGGHF